MPTSPTTTMIEQLRKAVLLRDGAGLGDAELLGGFIERRDEAALAALVKRHGPMVWGVCRRLLGHHDAEDAFQATFVVLVRMATSVAPRAMVGNWLYGVAHQTALQARRGAIRRRAREVLMERMPDAEAVTQSQWSDVQPVLDQELSRLPNHYRAVVVLCDLEGRTRKEAARHLGVPEGTVAGRLARARALLAKRLAQRGVVLSGGALAALLAQNAASASAPGAVVSNAIQAATLVAAGQTAATGAISAKVAALTEGTLKAMLMSKLKSFALLVLILCVLGTGAGLLARHTWAAGPPAARNDPSRTPESKAPAPKPKEDMEMLQGTWRVVGVDVGGIHQLKETSKNQIWVFTPGKLVIDYDDGSSLEMTCRLEPKKQPRAIDLSPTAKPEKGYTFKGIYELDGDRLKLYYSRNVAPDAERPTRFDPDSEDRGMRSFVLERAAQQPAGKGEPGKAAPEQQDSAAWGKEIGGLQAGLGFAGGKRVYTHGETVKVVARVRNVGKEAVDFKHTWAFLVENPPKLTDPDGKQTPLPGLKAMGGHGPGVQKLAPGKEIDLYDWEFDLRPKGEKSDKRLTLLGTGTFRLQCERVVGPTSANANHPNPALSKLATGTLELEVKAAPPAGK